MDIHKTTEGPNGIDLSVLPIVQLVPLVEDTGFLIVKQLEDYPVVYCTHDNCFELAEYMIFCSSRDESHAHAYNCKEHMLVLVELGKAGTSAYIKQ